MSKVVYLAGPITGLSYGEARNGWREYFPTLLADHIKPLSPMRGKDSLAGMARLKGNPDAYKETPITRAAGITGRDRNDVMTCDAVVANFLGAEIASIGTCIEFGWADAFRKPIIMIIEPKDNIHDHMMLSHLTTYKVNNLEDAAILTNLLLTPGV